MKRKLAAALQNKGTHLIHTAHSLLILILNLHPTLLYSTLLWFCRPPLVWWWWVLLLPRPANFLFTEPDEPYHQLTPQSRAYELSSHVYNTTTNSRYNNYFHWLTETECSRRVTRVEEEQSSEPFWGEFPLRIWFAEINQTEAKEPSSSGRPSVRSSTGRVVALERRTTTGKELDQMSFSQRVLINLIKFYGLSCCHGMCRPTPTPTTHTPSSNNSSILLVRPSSDKRQGRRGEVEDWWDRDREIEGLLVVSWVVVVSNFRCACPPRSVVVVCWLCLAGN